MMRLSKTVALIPKPYAEMAIMVFLEENFPEVCFQGVASGNDEERTFGEELYKEFIGWADFSKKTYAAFVRDLLKGLDEANLGYA
jgi:hypothetical protein